MHFCVVFIFFLKNNLNNNKEYEEENTFLKIVFNAVDVPTHITAFHFGISE